MPQAADEMQDQNRAGCGTLLQTEINHLRGNMALQIHPVLQHVVNGKENVMKIRCLNVFWSPLPTHTAQGCCAGVEFVSREIPGCLLLM